MEIWKDIEGYEGLYQVSNLGRVKSLSRFIDNKRGGWISKEIFLKHSYDSWGYQQIILTKNNIRKSFKLHRIIAQAFIPNPDNLPQVNHKNEIKDDNRIENLEWCDCKYNVNYGTRNKRSAEKASQRMTGKIGKLHNTSKPIIQLTKNGEFIKEWECSCSVTRQLGYSDSSIRQCCNGNFKQAYGYNWKWKYVYDIEQLYKLRYERYLKTKKVA